MAQKPKARGPTKPRPKAKGKAKEKTQRERFIEAARAVGVDETGREFDVALRKIVPPKQKT